MIFRQGVTEIGSARILEWSNVLRSGICANLIEASGDGFAAAASIAVEIVFENIVP